MGNINPNPFTTRPEIEGTFGVVTSTHWIATAVGMAILENGGNAFDAGVATAFTLQVVEPHLNGPGGDVPVIVYDVKRGKTEVICGQGPAPAKATIAHYRDEGLDLVPGTGLLAACVPGTFDTWMTLLRDYGTMRLRDVLEPAIGYAANGYPLVERISATIQTVEQLFREHWPTSAAVYLPDGKVPKPGTIFTNKKMAETYERILKEAESAGGDRDAQIERARKVWSQGFVAEAIDKFCRTQEVMDVSGSPHRGVLTADDMARWQATVEAPISYDYGRYTVLQGRRLEPGPGDAAAARAAQGLRSRRSRSARAGLHPSAGRGRQARLRRPRHVLRRSEVRRRADRDAAVGCLQRRAAQADHQDKASLEIRPGTVEGFGAVVKLRLAEGHRAAVGAMGAGEPTVGRFGEVPGDTVHFDIVDRDGNMVSSTPSGGWLHSSPVIPDLGFCLGTRAQMFWLEEDHPASLAPGKRPRSTLTPTMALRDGEPYLAWGSPGGDQQDQWITQFFLRHVHAEDESAGGDRRAGLAHRAFPDLVLAAHRAPRRARGRGPRAEGDARRVEAARPQRRDRPRLVRRPPHRRLEGRQAPPGRRQSARHAGLRGGTLMR